MHKCIVTLHVKLMSLVVIYIHSMTVLIIIEVVVKETGSVGDLVVSS